MSASDVIALFALVLAIISTGLGIRLQTRQTRLQLEASRDDAEERVGKYVVDVQHALGRFQEPTPTDPASFVRSAATLTEVQALALQADAVIRNEGVHPGWSGFVALAYAFAQTWDYKRALEYWNGALDLAPDPQWRVFVLRGRAYFYFSRGEPGDIDHGREDFRAALDQLDPQRDGADYTAEMNVATLTTQASVEIGIATDRQQATRCLNDARGLANSLHADWRKNRTLAAVDMTSQQLGL